MFLNLLTKSKYLLFSNSISKIKDANIIFIAVGTPSSRRGDGEADLKFVFSVVKDISKFLIKEKKKKAFLMKLKFLVKQFQNQIS